VWLNDQIGAFQLQLEGGRKTKEARGVFQRFIGALNGASSCPGVDGFTEDDWRGLEALERD
jgi:hypothetical protein